VKTRGWRRDSGELMGELAWSEAALSSSEALPALLRQALEEFGCVRARVSIILSDRWARSWMVTPPSNATTLADCVAAAEARHQVLFGESLSDWQLRADWHGSRPFLACAVPKSLLADLSNCAREHRLILQQIAPQFVVAWNRWRAQLSEAAWFGVMRENSLTVAALAAGGMQAVREINLHSEVVREQGLLSKLLAREALRMNIPKPEAISLCGELPQHWVMQQMDDLTFTRLDNPLPESSLPATAAVALAMTGMRL